MKQHDSSRPGEAAGPAPDHVSLRWTTTDPEHRPVEVGGLEAWRYIEDLRDRTGSGTVRARIVIIEHHIRR